MESYSNDKSSSVLAKSSGKIFKEDNLIVEGGI